MFKYFIKLINADKSYHFKSSASPSSAFTIVELLVVIVVIGILAAITIVSYTGITSKANITVMQSDLSNASQQLKLFQVENMAYPTTINCSIPDSSTNKCIKLSASNTYSYYPNNTASSQSFCLMAQNGTNIYSTDNNSAPVHGACLTNLVANGDFSSGTTGWNGNAVNLSASNKILTLTLVTIGNTNGTYRSFVSIVGDKYYFEFNALPKYGNNFYFGFDHNRNSVSGIIANTPNIVSTIGVSTISSDPITFYHDMSTSYAINDTFTIQNILVVDLTAIFGAGNEPTKAQMDTIMQQFPNKWFNGTALANM